MSARPRLLFCFCRGISHALKAVKEGGLSSRGDEQGRGEKISPAASALGGACADRAPHNYARNRRTGSGTAGLNGFADMNERDLWRGIPHGDKWQFITDWLDHGWRYGVCLYRCTADAT